MSVLQRGDRPRFILALLLLSAVTLATLDARGFGPVESARGVAVTALTPFRSVADWAMTPVSSTWNGVFAYRNLEEENAELRARLAELEGQEFREVTSREVLERIATQFDLHFADDIAQVRVQVVAGPANNFEDTVTIDKGSSSGIAVNMAVVTGSGLVGRVDQVTPNRAVVRLISDPRMRVGARLISSGASGIIEGRGSRRNPHLVVSRTVDLTAGDRLETSGLAGSLYPPAIPIGVVQPAPDEGDDDITTTTVAGATVLPDLESVGSQRVRVHLAAELDRLSFLTVLLWEPPS